MSSIADFQRLLGRLRMRHLALLERLGKDPNLGRAAKQLHMTQPTASKLLREIEAIFDDTLFVRNRRGMTPTPAGEALTRRAGVLIAELKATQAELHATKQGASGRLRLGVFPVVVPDFLPRLLAVLRQNWEGLHVSLVEAIEHPLLVQLSEGEVDCILGRVVMETLTPDLRHETLYNEPTVVVCGVSHPVLRAQANQYAQILGQSSWMLPAPRGTIYSMVASWLAAYEIPAPVVEIETTSVFATLEVLNHSSLLSILPKNVADAYAALGKVALVPQGSLFSGFPVGIIYRADAVSNPLIKTVLASARACAAVSVVNS